jgi:hypothetical protein
LTIEGRSRRLSTSIPDIAQDLVSPDYFHVMGVPIREDEALGCRSPRAPEVAIVNRHDKYFPGVVDRAADQMRHNRRRTVVIIVGAGNQRVSGYFPGDEVGGNAMRLSRFFQAAPTEARCSCRPLPPASMGGTIQRLVARLNRIFSRRYSDVRQHFEESGLSAISRRGARRFAGLALLLAVVGLARSSHRPLRNEFTSSAFASLGATSWDIVRLVGGQGGIPTPAGVSVGVIGAVVFQRLLSSLLYGVMGAGLMALAALGLLLVTTAAVAMFVRRRAAGWIRDHAALR